jgi:hypothetical protein
VNISRQPRPALKFAIPSDLAVSVAFTCTSCFVIGIPFALVSFEEMEDCSIRSRVSSFLWPYEALGGFLHDHSSNDERLLHVLLIYILQLYSRALLRIQSVPGGKVNILGVHIIGHSKKKFM